MAVTVSGTSITFNDGTSQNTTAMPLVSAGTYYQTNEGSSVSHNASNWKAGNIFILNVSGTVRIRMEGRGGVASDGKGTTLYCAAYYDLYKNGVSLGRFINAPANGNIQVVTTDQAVNRGDRFQIYLYVTGGGFNTYGSATAGVSVLSPIKISNIMQAL